MLLSPTLLAFGSTPPDTVVFTLKVSPWSICSQNTLLMGYREGSNDYFLEPQGSLGLQYDVDDQWQVGMLVGFSSYSLGLTPFRIGAQGTYRFTIPNYEGVKYYGSLALGTQRTYQDNWWQSGFMEGERLRGWAHGSMGLEWRLPRWSLRTGLGYQIQSMYQSVDDPPVNVFTRAWTLRRMTWDMVITIPFQKVLSIERR